MTVKNKVVSSLLVLTLSALTFLPSQICDLKPQKTEVVPNTHATQVRSSRSEIQAPRSIPEPQQQPKPAPQPVQQPQKITFRVTAYCPCEKCCGKWSHNRPVDANGQPIVYGANNVRLTPGVSAGGTLPFGTKVKLDGYGTVVIQDRPAQWVVDRFGSNIIDIYMPTHAQAEAMALKTMTGVIVK